ncbi:hypothetical protein NQ318_003969 [Aromia moschata]|uniref:Uncharacterized protein n=1 Tax=Aromia moschata TaxID=1265417 RepID=A0AAV8Z8X3_9CUCU|nr:hypothetical protein NQ318_003969 [Aromia moschata]
MSKVKQCVGKEGFQRMNYLYQASNAIATESKANNVASVFYTNLLVNVSKRQSKGCKDIAMKRTVCKGCRCLLLAGVTCKVRIKKKKVIWTCMSCRTSKVFEIRNRNYMPWTQRKESVVDILDYTPQQDLGLEKNNK